MKNVNEGLLEVARAMTLATTRLQYRVDNLARFTALIAIRTGMTREAASRAIRLAMENADAQADVEIRKLDETHPVGKRG